MVPVPPRQFCQPIGNVFGKPAPNRAGRISGDDGVGRYVLGHDRACGDHGAGADAAARQYDGAMPDPDIMVDADVMPAPPIRRIQPRRSRPENTRWRDK